MIRSLRSPRWNHRKIPCWTRLSLEDLFRNRIPDSRRSWHGPMWSFTIYPSVLSHRYVPLAFTSPSSLLIRYVASALNCSFVRLFQSWVGCRFSCVLLTKRYSHTDIHLSLIILGSYCVWSLPIVYCERYWRKPSTKVGFFLWTHYFSQHQIQWFLRCTMEILIYVLLLVLIVLGTLSVIPRSNSKGKSCIAWESKVNILPLTIVILQAKEMERIH